MAIIGGGVSAVGGITEGAATVLDGLANYLTGAKVDAVALATASAERVAMKKIDKLTKVIPGQGKKASKPEPKKETAKSEKKGEPAGDGVKIPANKDPRYARGKFRKGKKEKVFEDAKGPDGKVRDPKTHEEIKFDDEWDMGHKPGYEHRKHQESASARDLSRKDFVNEYNDTSHYRPETPATNRGHSIEAPADIYLGK